MEKKILRQEIDLDIFLEMIGIFNLGQPGAHISCNEDGDRFISIEEDNLIISDYTEGPEATPKTKTVPIPKTIQDGFNLIPLIYNEDYTEEEKEDILFAYQAELARQDAFVRINQYQFTPKFEK